jgi:outer membrane biosynthesis protein TonB
MYIIYTRLARGVDPSLDQEALRVVNSLPEWKPGYQRGEAVNVSYTVPFNFALE